MGEIDSYARLPKIMNVFNFRIYPRISDRINNSNKKEYNI